MTRRMATWRLVLALGFGSLLVATPAGAQDEKKDAGDAGPEYVPGEILVKLAAGARASGIANALERVGGSEVRSFASLGVRHWRLGAGMTVERAVEILSKSPHTDDVEYAEPNYVVHAHDTLDDPLRGDLWGMHNVGQANGTADADADVMEAWAAGFTGSPGVVVGVIDTGIHLAHPDLAANVWTNPGEVAGNGIDDDHNGYVDDVHGWDFVNGDNDPTDDNVHGTHTSGTIGAVGNNGVGVAGVAWNVRLMPLKFLNASGGGSTSDAVTAIQYAASFKDASGNQVVRITNNSWGGGAKSRALQAAIEACGALFVASAGNHSSSTIEYPAGYPSANVLSVAATDRNDALASFSNFSSTWVDLGAPGVDTLSTVPGGGYGTMSGTSMACPHVAGAAALLLAKTPSLTIDGLKSALLSAVDPRPSLAGKVLSGGRLNVRRALGVASELPDDPVAPSQVTDLSATAASGNLLVAWTAPGDDGALGSAYLYDLRYRTDGPVTDANWATSTQVAGEPLPAPAGAVQSWLFTAGMTGPTYSFGLRAIDEKGNSAPLSNAAAGTIPGAPWTSELVMDTGDVGWQKSLAFDLAGNPTIAYSDVHFDTGVNEVKLARRSAAGVWTSEVVVSGKPALGSGIDHVILPNGSPAVSYVGAGSSPMYNDSSGRLDYSEWTGSSWTSVTVESKNANNECTSLAVDGAGQPAISYRMSGNSTTTFGLRLARRSSAGTWTKVMVDQGAAAIYSSLAFDASGRPWIAYSHDADGDTKVDTLRVARPSNTAGTSWTIDTIESGVANYGTYAGIAFDPATGYPSVIHSPGGTAGVRYLTWNGSAWSAAEVVGAGGAGSLAFDASGTPIVARINSAVRPSALALARRSGGVWVTESFLGGVILYGRIDLRVSPGGRAAIAWAMANVNDLMYSLRSE